MQVASVAVDEVAVAVAAGAAVANAVAVAAAVGADVVPVGALWRR